MPKSKGRPKQRSARYQLEPQKKKKAKASPRWYGPLMVGLLGFGGFASVELLMVALSSSGHVTPPVVNWTNSLAYDLAVVTWLCYALMKSPSRDASANLLMSHRWERSLVDIQNPLPGDSLIPMFEGMVDRAFSRTNGEPSHDEQLAEPLPSKLSAKIQLGDPGARPRLTSKF